MDSIRDDTAIAERLMARMEGEFARDRPALERARSKLFALIPPPEALDAGQSYAVDIEAARFAVKQDETEVASGPLQVIGTYGPGDGGWMWGWEDPSSPPQATRELAAFAQAEPVLEGIAQCARFQAREEFCERLAQWTAVKGGWMGAYPAQEGESIRFLAVTPSLHDESGSWSNSLWCSLCGAPSTHVRKLITSGGSAAAICSSCAERLRDTPATDEDSGPPCLMCGETSKPRISTDYSAICETCVRTMNQIVDAR